MTPRHVAVIDIGKTNAKVVLVRMADLAELAVRTRPNTVLPGPPYPHFDADGLWAFALDGLAALNAVAPVEAIVATTHGAAAALVDAHGGLVLPVLDYEHPLSETAADYDALRPGFEETGSPRMANGLNLGAQLHWQARAFPDAFARVARIVTWPGYWGLRLAGAAACDHCSMGAHTDLWNPHAGAVSTLADRLGIADRLAPVRAPDALLGTLRPDIAAATGLAEVPVRGGIHDSNASLLPHLLARAKPFAVVSTGTWVVVMAPGGRAAGLDPARNTLVNVDAFGAPVPSATFMGGREFALTVPAGAGESAAAVARVLAERIMLLPGLTHGTGPYPWARQGWRADPAALTADERHAAVSLYLALMTETCLGMVGAAGPVLVEGPLARNGSFLGALQALTGTELLPQPDSATGTSAGAALLAAMPVAPPATSAASPPGPDAAAGAIRDYGAAWRPAAAELGPR